VEYRLKCSDIDFREGQKIGGYINVTERESEILYNKQTGKWFKETMKQGVFKRALEKAKEIPMLLQHDWNKKLASTENSTLKLEEDNIGLRFEATIEDRQAYEDIKNKKINACSFGFRALEEKRTPVDSRLEKREVSEIELLEVSIVSNPAYIGSLCEARAYEDALEEDRKKENDSKGIDDSKHDKDEESKENHEKEEKAPMDENSTKEDAPKDKEEAPKQEDAPEDTKEDEKKKVETNSCDTKVKKRELEEVIPTAVEESTEVENKDYIKSLVEDLIEQKLSQIEGAQVEEAEAQQDLEMVQQVNSAIEADAEQDLIRKTNELIKLKLELLKLHEIKRGI